MADTRLCRIAVGVTAFLGIANMLGFHLWPCLFAKITGLPCPGCGMTRATVALIKGDWAASFAYHPFAAAFAIFGILLALVAILPQARRQQLAASVGRFERLTALPLLLLFAALLYGLLRMSGVVPDHTAVRSSPASALWKARLTGSHGQ